MFGETELSFETFELDKLKIIVGAMNLFEEEPGPRDQNIGFALFGLKDQSRLLFVSTAGLTILLINFLSRNQWEYPYQRTPYKDLTFLFE